MEWFPGSSNIRSSFGPVVRPWCSMQCMLWVFYSVATWFSNILCKNRAIITPYNGQLNGIQSQIYHHLNAFTVWHGIIVNIDSVTKIENDEIVRRGHLLWRFILQKPYSRFKEKTKLCKIWSICVDNVINRMVKYIERNRDQGN